MAIALAEIEPAGEQVPAAVRARIEAAARLACGDQPVLVAACLADWGVCDALLREAELEARGGHQASEPRELAKVRRARSVLALWHQVGM